MSKGISISLTLFATILVALASVQQGSLGDDPVYHFMDGSPKAVYPAPGQMKGPGILPATVMNCTYLGIQDTISGPIYRDMGFTGVLSGLVIWTYADTLWQTNPILNKYAFLASETFAFGRIDNHTAVYDFNVTPTSKTYPKNFVPLLPDEVGHGPWGFATSNVIEIAPNQGIVWFLKNDRTHGPYHIIGAGVTTVTANLTHGLTVNRTVDHMWEWAWLEPKWGDTGVTYNPQDGFVYVLGSGAFAGTYLARVQATEALNVSAYTYWDNHTQTWNDTRFGDGTNGTANYTIHQALWGWLSHGASNPFWSNYYNTWMTVYGSGWSSSNILYSTAPNLWGPWTPGKLACISCLPDLPCKGMRYSMNPHPEYDITGKTLLVSWSMNNLQRLVTITWE